MHQHDGPLARLRQGHETLVLDLLRRHGPLTRAGLGTHTGLSRTTLYDIVGGLVTAGAVVTAPPEATARRRGRPVETLSLNPAAGLAIGIDFARRAVHVAAVNVAHEVVGSASEQHPAGLSWDRRIALARRLVGTLAGGSLRLDPVTGIGAGLVGPVGLPALGGPGPAADPGPWEAAGTAEAVRDRLAEAFGVPVHVDNNTRLAALAESVWGAATGSRDVLYLRLSHGVGGGLVVGGALHGGAHGLSGELGHITVDPAGGPCDCGGRGCLETVASVGAVLDAYRAAGGRAADIAGFTAAARDGDAVAAGVLRAVGSQVGGVLAAVCNAVGPGVVVVGGELAEAGDLLLGPVRETLSARVLPLARSLLDLRRAALGEYGGALGGIALVLHASPLLAHYPARPEPGPRPQERPGARLQDHQPHDRTEPEESP
ncbi:transcriptional regulator [Kitasatospora indigofera]|uniref:Transcriptional regulator n=1 Tax=Kitasatospora indigofera TaxID=67307 RepID=A0A919FSQ9_9ACTN|nr:ROK family transcriptional regulator [Kitasatospora indigofera]GHH71917.1 transcriptional regulator [Kitasatospora indigofera]